MKTKTIYVLMGVVTILSVARVDAATIFSPTDGDVNFLFGDLQGATLAIFDDSDQAYEGDFLNVQIPGIVGFVGPQPNGDFIATNSLGTLPLTGSDNFILGLDTGGGNWIADSSVASNGGNAYTVTFGTGANVVQVDVQIIPAIPVPAAVWLFGSGLLGLVGGAVRRKARVGVVPTLAHCSESGRPESDKRREYSCNFV